MTDQELIGYLDRLDQKIDRLREENREENRQTRSTLEEEIRQTREENRQTRVVMEGIRSEVHLVAEGVIGQGEVSATRQLETLRMIHEVKAMIVPLYQDLNGRVKVLEERASRESRDVLDVIRERFGKH